MVIDTVHDPRRLTLVDRNGRREISVDKADSNMVYEFAEFLRLVESRSAADRWNGVTEHRLELMDAVRARMGLRFPADP